MFYLFIPFSFYSSLAYYSLNCLKLNDKSVYDIIFNGNLLDFNYKALFLFGVKGLQMVDEYIKTLIDLTIVKDKVKIKELLQNILNSNEKGIVFEEYIRLLYVGNGWLAVRNGSTNDFGADVLLFHTKSPNRVAIIIQAKNHLRPLEFYDTKVELLKFEEKGRNKYNCNSYMIISINGFVKEAEKLRRYNMKLENWECIESLIDTYDVNGKSEPVIELYAHNQIAYEASKALFKHNNRVAIVQATGTGKSFIIIKHISEIFDKQALILAPQKYIIEQIRNDGQWITQNTSFLTYAKLKNLTDEEIKSLNLDFIVLDEFHRCGAELWGEGVRRLLNCYGDANVLGTSATPIRYLDDNRDMSDELFDGNIAVNLSLSEALVRRILPMPIYISALYTLDDELDILQKKIENNIVTDTEDLTKQVLDYKKNWEKSKGIPKMLKKYISGEDLKFIVFCENKEHLNEMLWLVEMWFTKAKLGKRVRKYIVSSGSRENDAELDNFKTNQNKDEIKLLFAIDMLNEGVHISGISGVILLRSTRSPRIFYQQIGRAIEAGGQSKQPLIFDFVNNFNNICADDFLFELKVAREKENKLRDELGLGENCPPFTVHDETKDEIEFFRSIEDKLTHVWDYWYDELVKYKKVQGNTLVSKADKENYELSKWIYAQRKAYSDGLLIQNKIDKLNEIDFCWDAKRGLWQLRYQQLTEFYKKNGHCMVKRVEDRQLGHWVVKQRQWKNSGSLSNEKIAALNELNFEWDYDDVWYVRYKDLLEYKRKFGTSDVPRGYNTKDIQLGSWVNMQRMLRKKGELPQHLIDLLDEIEFEWSPLESKWNEMFNELLEFKKILGHCSVSRADKDYAKLSNWVGAQRVFFKKGKLSPERINKLKEIEFDFQPPIGQPRKKKAVSKKIDCE